jgi:hypothetical protein
MPGLVPGIHVLAAAKKDVDGRVKPGHDDGQRAWGEQSEACPRLTCLLLARRHHGRKNL